MRILLISREITFPGQFGSPRPYQFAKHLAEKHEIKLIFPYSSEQALEKLQRYSGTGSLFKDIRVFDMRSKNASLLRRAFNLLIGNVSFETQIKLPRRFAQVVEAVKSFSKDSDVIWVDGLATTQYITNASRPVLADPTDCISRNYSLQNKRIVSPLKRAINKWLTRSVYEFERRALSRATVSVVNSHVDAQYMRERHIGNPEVVPNGCDTDYFSPDRSIPKLDGNPAIVFVGNFGYAPNYDAAEMISKEIAPSVFNRHPNAKFYLVGPFPKNSFRTHDDRIIATGFVPDVRTYYGGADLFISPLRYGTGVKNKLLEAAAMQCAIIASLATTESLLFRNEEHFLLADTPFDFVTQIDVLLNNLTLRRRIQRKARNLVVQEYSWKAQAELFENLLESLCRNSRQNTSLVRFSVLKTTEKVARCERTRF